ncbi:hypothetical protein [Hydrogenophaga palleronii]|uniref:hypothetical protein n=1 Tax=Hydrogenophaga palleronii TaxID=65655 RepID=UPI0012ED5B27|nr:hypothetical protein [Hydrogenophaga palleronii]
MTADDTGWPRRHHALATHLGANFQNTGATMQRIQSCVPCVDLCAVVAPARRAGAV